MEKKLISVEKMKQLAEKLHFKNKAIELVDNPVLNLINNVLLDKIAEKLSDEALKVVQQTIEEVIDDMPEIEI